MSRRREYLEKFFELLKKSKKKIKKNLSPNSFKLKISCIPLSEIEVLVKWRQEARHASQI